MGRLRRLELSDSGIKELPGNFGYLESLQSLSLTGCSNFKKFPEIQGNMKHLEYLSLARTAIRGLPTSIGCLEALMNLSLANTAIKELPHSIRHLTGLQWLSLESCKNLKSLPSHIGRMKSLKEIYVDGCSNLECFVEITKGYGTFRKPLFS